MSVSDAGLPFVGFPEPSSARPPATPIRFKLAVSTSDTAAPFALIMGGLQQKSEAIPYVFQMSAASKRHLTFIQLPDIQASFDYMLALQEEYWKVLQAQMVSLSDDGQERRLIAFSTGATLLLRMLADPEKAQQINENFDVVVVAAPFFQPIERMRRLAESLQNIPIHWVCNRHAGVLHFMAQWGAQCLSEFKGSLQQHSAAKAAFQRVVCVQSMSDWITNPAVTLELARLMEQPIITDEALPNRQRWGHSLLKNDVSATALLSVDSGGNVPGGLFQLMQEPRTPSESACRLV